jgi:hypothetical protein
MRKSCVANKVTGARSCGEVWFMAPRKLSEAQIHLLLRIYLRVGNKFPAPGRVCKVSTHLDTPPPQKRAQARPGGASSGAF